MKQKEDEIENKYRKNPELLEMRKTVVKNIGGMRKKVEEFIKSVKKRYSMYEASYNIGKLT